MVNKGSGKVVNSGDEFVDKITETTKDNDDDDGKKKTVKEATEDFIEDIK